MLFSSLGTLVILLFRCYFLKAWVQRLRKAHDLKVRGLQHAGMGYPIWNENVHLLAFGNCWVDFNKVYFIW